MIARLVDRFGRMLTNRNAATYGAFSASDTAVLALCTQVDVFEPNGEWSRLCPIGPDAKTMGAFLGKCREVGWPVIHSPLALHADGDPSALSATRHLRELRSRQLLRVGSPGAQIEPSLLDAADLVLPERKGLNAFAETGLMEVLGREGRKRLVIVGGVANADTDSSTRAAVEYDFDASVVSDLTFAYDQADSTNTLTVTLPRIANRVLDSNSVV